MLNINITGVEELRKKLSDIDLNYVDSTWIKHSTLIIQSEAVENIPPNWDTGNMARNVLYENLGSIGYVRANAPYSIFIHEGTKFFKRPNPFMKKAKENKEGELIQNYKILLTNHIKKLGLSS